MERGQLRCGVSETRISAEYLAEGRWAGFEVDICRAIAAAVLGDADRVDFAVLVPPTRFEALKAGAVDVLFSNSTWTYSRDVDQPIDFVAVIFYDGQGFAGYSGMPEKLSEVKGVTVCVMKETTTETNLTEYIMTRAPTWSVLGFSTEEGRDQAFLTKRCTLQTNDYGSLVNLKDVHPEAGLFLYPDIISKEPLSAVVRANDSRWADTVRWAIFALITAEELGVTQANVDALAAAADGTDFNRRPLLGKQPGFGNGLGLPDDWAYQAIRQVGNYADIFNRNLGAGSPLKLERGLNRLWTQGGLMYAPPLR